jgi:DNA replication licensing factor MCM4
MDEDDDDDDQHNEQQQQPELPEEREPLLPPDANTLIRGTDVHVPTAAAAFEHFLLHFVSLQQAERANNDNDADDNHNDLDSIDSSQQNKEPLYLTKLQDILTNGGVVSEDDERTSSLDIDTMHLFYHSPDCQRFYQQLLSYPMELVPLMDLLIKRQLERMAGPDQFIPRVQVRPFNLKSLSHMRSLDPVKMDSLLSVRGMIVRSSPIIPDLKVAHFQCCICGHDAQVRIDRGRIQEPHACPQCACRDSYSMVHNRCIFADKQLVRLQETPDEVPAGQTPASVVTFCFDDLVDSVKPGDRVEVTGVLRAQPRRVNPKISKLKSVYKTYIDVIHFRRVTGMEGTQDETNESRTSMQTRFTPERVEQMLALSKDPQIYTKLTQSLAPSIWELDDVKKGVLAMMFGGNHVRVKKGTVEKKRDAEDDDSWASDEEEPKSKNEEVNTKLNKRGDINILLCGDPGTSKSQLLSYVNKLSSRGVYTSGKGSSAVGLTASVVRDPETRELVLESGALVLSDLGICCIDEFDKMSGTYLGLLLKPKVSAFF